MHRGPFAEPFKLALLQDAQQFGLQVQRHFADFIKENRAAVGQFEFAGTVCNRPGEGAFAVTEEFAFEKRFRHRGAVHGDKWLAAAIARVVHEPREQFFTRSAFGLNQNIRSGAGCCARPLQRAHEGRRMTDDVPVGVRIFDRDLTSTMNHLRCCGLQAIKRNRLGEIIERTIPHRSHGVGHGTIRGQQNDSGFRRCLPRGPHHFHSRTVGHAHVGHHQVEVATFHVAHRFAHA